MGKRRKWKGGKDYERGIQETVGKGRGKRRWRVKGDTEKELEGVEVGK